MNIVLLCENFFKDCGGIETFAREFAVALGRRGHRVHVIAKDVGNRNRDLRAQGVETHAIPLKETPFSGYWKIDSFFPLDDLRFAHAAAKKIYELNRKDPLDIVEAMDYFRQGIWLAINKKFALFLRLHGWMFNRQDGRVNPIKKMNMREKFLWHFQQKCIKEADGVAAVSKDFRDFVREVWRVGNKPLGVIHNAVDSTRYTTGKPQEQREQAIIFAARLAKIKGIKVLADSAAEILKEFPEVKFYFAGKNVPWAEEGITAQDYLTQKIPSRNLVILGEVAAHEVTPYYQRCQICVLPSLYEPFGIMALEAMACGCALVASASGGLKDIVEDGEDGLLVTPNDSKALAAAILRFFKDVRLREKCSQNGVKKVRDRFNYDRLVDESIVAYQDAIRNFQDKLKRSRG